MLLDARKFVIFAQKNEGETLIIAQQHVVRRAEALDELRFQEQRLGLRARRYHRHRARLRNHALQALREPCDLCVAGHAILQGPRLADVEDLAARILHAIDAGPNRKRLQHFADRGDALLEVGLVGPAHGIGRLLFVEALC